MQWHSRKSMHLGTIKQGLQTCKQQHNQIRYFDIKSLPFLQPMKSTKTTHETISYLVFIGFSFLGLKPESMQVLSHANLPFPNFFGQVMHF